MNNRCFIAFLLALTSLAGFTATPADDLNADQRIAESQHWDGDAFRNPEQVPDVEVWASLKMFWRYYNKPDGYIPASSLPAEPFDITKWYATQGLQFIWLGHTTFLIKIDNKVVLTDPIFSERAGSYGWVSPRRYSKTLPAANVLPELDMILITHNHSDHLDEASIKSLISRTKHFVTPLAVGGLLEEWGGSS